MEEWIGQQWHRLVTRWAEPGHAAAAVSLDEMRKPLGLTIIGGLVFSPVAVDWVQVARPLLGQSVVLAYIPLALLLLAATSRMHARPGFWIGAALCLDILAASLVHVSLVGASTAVPSTLFAMPTRGLVSTSGTCL